MIVCGGLKTHYGLLSNLENLMPVTDAVKPASIAFLGVGGEFGEARDPGATAGRGMPSCRRRHCSHARRQTCVTGPASVHLGLGNVASEEKEPGRWLRRPRPCAHIHMPCQRGRRRRATEPLNHHRTIPSAPKAVVGTSYGARTHALFNPAAAYTRVSTVA